MFKALLFVPYVYQLFLSCTGLMVSALGPISRVPSGLEPWPGHLYLHFTLILPSPPWTMNQYRRGANVRGGGGRGREGLGELGATYDGLAFRPVREAIILCHVMLQKSVNQYYSP